MAGNAQGIRAGRAFVEIAAYVDPLQKGLRASKAMLMQFGAGVKMVSGVNRQLGSAMAVPIQAAAKSVVSGFNRSIAMANQFGAGLKNIAKHANLMRASLVSSFANATNAITRHLRNSQKMLNHHRQEIGKAAKSSAAAGAVIAAPMALSVAQGLSFDKTMSRVKALSRASGEEFELLRSKAREMGRTTVYTSTQAAEAMANFAQAGYDTSKIMQVIEPTLNLAAVGQLDMATASDVAIKAMQGLGMDASQFNHVVDVLSKGTISANTDIVQLGEAFKYAAPIAKFAGLSIEETVALIMGLSDAGIQADMAGTTIRGMLMALTSPSEEARKVLNELGISIKDSSGDVRPIISIIADLQTALSGLGSADQLDIIGRLFENRQATGVAEFLSLGAEKLQTTVDALTNSAGTAARVAETQLDNLDGEFQILNSAIEDLKLEISDALNPTLRSAAGYFTKITTAVQSFISQNRGLVLISGAVATGLIAAGAALMGVAVGMKLVSLAISGAIVLLTVLKMAFMLVFSPVGLLIALVAGLTYTILHFTGTSGKALDFLANNFGWLVTQAKESFAAIGSALARGDIAGAANILWLSIKSAFIRGTAGVRKIWLDLKHGMIQAWVEVEKAIQKGFVWIVTQFEKARAMLARAGETLGNSYANTEEKKAAYQTLKSTNAELDAQFAAGELTDEQFAKKRAQAEKIYHDQINYANKAHDAEEKASQEAANKRLAELDAYYQESMAMLDKEHSQTTDANAAELLKSQQEIDKQIQDARAAYQAAIGGEAQKDSIAKNGWLWGKTDLSSDAKDSPAAKLKEQSEAQKDSIAKNGWLWGKTDLSSDAKDSPAAKLKEQIGSLKIQAQTALDTNRTGTALGGFSAAAAFGWGSDSLSERTAKAAETTAQNTAIIARLAAQPPAYT